MSTSTLGRSTSAPSGSTPAGAPRLPSVARLSSLALLVITLTVLSISLYWMEHHKARHALVLGDAVNPGSHDRHALDPERRPSHCTHQRSGGTQGSGALVDDRTHDLKEDATLISNAVTNPTVVAKANERPEFVSVQFALRDGIITDYPLRQLHDELPFPRTDGQRRESAFGPDPGCFRQHRRILQSPSTTREIHRGTPRRQAAKTIATPQSIFAATATVERSTSTVMFAVFIMVFMWCLTIAALIAAWYVASGRLGLFWSALGFLGTLLFALIPLRNAVPGDPPIGSLIDFAAFFIAEGVVSISMIVTVLHGYHIEISNKKRKAAPDDDCPHLEGEMFRTCVRWLFRRRR